MSLPREYPIVAHFDENTLFGNDKRLEFAHCGDLNDSLKACKFAKWDNNAKAYLIDVKLWEWVEERYGKTDQPWVGVRVDERHWVGDRDSQQIRIGFHVLANVGNPIPPEPIVKAHVVSGRFSDIGGTLRRLDYSDDLVLQFACPEGFAKERGLPITWTKDEGEIEIVEAVPTTEPVESPEWTIAFV